MVDKLEVKSQDQVVEAEKRILSQLESGITDQRLSDLSFYYMGLIVVCCRYVAALKKSMTVLAHLSVVYNDYKVSLL